MLSITAGTAGNKGTNGFRRRLSDTRFVGFIVMQMREQS